ncbi:FadR/GntR family transcriptional regulator [Roseospira visakhapatnamensis]|uniref:DNA-binding FadR family transcriptional regulator n=1 Tax=Roseospira visakhapatnamensis TaxID=390880 RepID=A0A7W6RBV3_9PROT|nr:FadR/GntR family transcriptional regulator [Roseospira visakhapatnamensis]MBB4265527.1 DNA-binding FadR family transcriptional regulator [Roseospira visakhapatnamensis]
MSRPAPSQDNSPPPLPAGPHGTTRDLGNRVAESLARALFSGQYPAGSLLPKELELAERFCVSRASVRAGLQSLTALGIISRHAGQGTMVREYGDWNILDPLVTRWMADYAAPNPEILRQIFEFRRTTEPFISALAAERATARDLMAIEDEFLGMERTLEDTALGATLPRAFSEHDVAFHAAIYRATHNLVWAQLAHILRPTILIVIRKTNDTADELRDSLGRHRRLMESIRLRQPEAAFRAAVRVMTRTGLDLGLEDPDAIADPDLLAHAWMSTPPGTVRPGG